MPSCEDKTARLNLPMNLIPRRAAAPVQPERLSQRGGRAGFAPESQIILHLSSAWLIFIVLGLLAT
jgi:hypothetical protein